MAFKAVEEPRLMQARREVMMKEMRTERRGMFQPGATWDIQVEPGTPLSRAKDL